MRVKSLKCVMVCVRLPVDMEVLVEKCMAEDGYTNRSLWIRDLVLGRVMGGGSR